MLTCANPLLIRRNKIEIGEVVSFLIVKCQELGSGARKIDFAALFLIPGVPHDPVRKIRQRELFWDVDRQVAIRSRFIVEIKLNGLGKIRIHDCNFIFACLLHLHSVIRPLAIFGPSDV